MAAPPDRLEQADPYRIRADSRVFWPSGAKISEERRFASPVDGSRVFLSPEESMRIQRVPNRTSR
jgi:hypothetical protein